MSGTFGGEEEGGVEEMVRPSGVEGVSGGDRELLRLSSSPDRNVCVAINVYIYYT